MSDGEVEVTVNPDSSTFAGWSDHQIWAVVTDDTWDEDLLCDPEPRRPLDLVARRVGKQGPSSPTQIREIDAARDALDVLTTVALAVRRGRRTARLSQRSMASSAGVSQSAVARVEAHPGEVSLARVVSLLAVAGVGLAVVDGDGAVVGPDTWSASELVARDLGGRRLPGHHSPGRIDEPRRWHPRGHPALSPEAALWTWRRESHPGAETH